MRSGARRDGHGLARRQHAVALHAVEDHAHRQLPRAVGDLDARAARQHERTRGERVRRHERHAERLHAPVQHRPAGREAVAGRARGRADDHGVAGQLAEVDAVDVPAEPRDAPLHVARDHDVVDGQAAALPRSLDLHGRELHGAQLARQRTAHGGLQLIGLRGREKADAPEVDAEDGDAAARHLLQRAQDGAVATEHDDQIGLGDVAAGRQQLDARLVGEARDHGRGIARRPAGLQGHAAHVEAVSRRHRAAAVADRPGRSAASGWSLETMCRKNSRLPAGPGWPLSQAPSTTPPASAATPAIRSSTATCTPASRTTPRRASPRPASNCGLTSGSRR